MVWTCTKLAAQHHERTQGWPLLRPPPGFLMAIEHCGTLLRSAFSFFSSRQHSTPSAECIADKLAQFIKLAVAATLRLQPGRLRRFSGIGYQPTNGQATQGAAPRHGLRLAGVELRE